MKTLSIAIVLASLILSLARLGKWALLDYDEATYGTVYYESSRRDDLLYPTYLGKPWFEKPLYFWLTHLSVKLLTENEFSLRLPSAMLISASVILVFLIVFDRTQDQITALLSAIILATSGYFVFIGRQMRPDIPVIASQLLAFYSFLRLRKRPIWALMFGLGVAAGILFKSIIGLLIYIIILIFSIIYRDWSWIRSKWFWLGNIVTVILIFPWLLSQHIKFGNAFWNFYLSYNIVSRLTETIVVGPKTPFSYHIIQLFTVSQPWLLTLIILGLPFIMWLKSKREHSKFELASLATITVIFGMFSLSQTRLLYYYLPLFPFVAMFLGSLFRHLLKKHPITTGIALFLLVSIGLANTLARTFFPQDRDFFLQTIAKPSRYMIAEEEKKVASIAAEERLSLYVYNWQFYPTLIYYATVKNGVHIARVYKGSILDAPFLLLVPTPLFQGKNSLPIQTSRASFAQILFPGDVATLLKVTVL